MRLTLVHYFDKQENAILTKIITPGTMNLHHLRFNNCTFSSAFMCALQHWKPQTISFLDLPGEIRNQIYHLLIHDSDDRYFKLQNLGPQMFVPLPPVLFIQTCKQVKTELLPLYIRTINPRFQVRNRQSQSSGSEVLHLSASQILEWLDEYEPGCTDYFHSMTLETENCNFFCRVLVMDSKVVYVQIYSFIRGFSFNVLKHLSVGIRDKILRSLATSPTGLLGYQHLAIAERELGSLPEWHEWKTQDSAWQLKKDAEALWHLNRHPTDCSAPKCYVCYLITQAEKEGVPRLIPAVSVEDARQTLQRYLWFRDEKMWHIKKSSDLDGIVPSQHWLSQHWWLFEEVLEEAEQESMPRLIRAAPSPLDELEMYERCLRML